MLLVIEVIVNIVIMNELIKINDTNLITEILFFIITIFKNIFIKLIILIVKYNIL